MSDENPYEGIAKTVSNSWECKPTPPLTAESLQRGIEAMLREPEERREREAKIAAEYRKAMKDPEFAARQDALAQACAELNCPQPDPLRPRIISPKLYEAVNARADEILAARKHHERRISRWTTLAARRC